MHVRPGQYATRLNHFHLSCFEKKTFKNMRQDKIPRTEVLKTAVMHRVRSSTFTLVQLAQLRWTGHVTRMPVERLPKKVCCGELQEEKCSQSDQKKRYEETKDAIPGSRHHDHRAHLFYLQLTVWSYNWLKQPSKNTQSHMNTYYSGFQVDFLNTDRHALLLDDIYSLFRDKGHRPTTHKEYNIYTKHTIRYIHDIYYCNLFANRFDRLKLA